MENDLYIKLLKLIRTRYLESDKLPPEEVLAAELGISRVKLRDVLAVLEVQGYINRKKGVGTLINRCLVNEPVRLDIDAIYEETVREAGFRARTQVRSIQYLEKTPEEIAKILGVDPAESTYAVEKVIYADETPVIFLRDYVLASFYNQTNIDMELLEKSTFAFVERYVPGALESIVVHLDACEANEAVAQALQLRQGEPVLRLDSTCFSIRSESVLCSVEYHNTKILPYCIYKRMNRTRFYTLGTHPQENN